MSEHPLAVTRTDDESFELAKTSTHFRRELVALRSDDLTSITVTGTDPGSFFTAGLDLTDDEARQLGRWLLRDRPRQD